MGEQVVEPMQSPTGSAHGQCLCGQVRFEVSLPTRWCAHCHCTMCRRAHGAAFVTWFGVDEEAFRLTAGDDRLRWYPSSDLGRRGFCKECGTTLLFESGRWAGERHVTLASMLDPIDLEPQLHAFFDSHVDWIVLADALPRFAENGEIIPS